VRGVAGVRAAVPVAVVDSRPGPRAAVAECPAIARLAAAALPCGRGVLAPAGVGRVGAPVTVHFPRGAKTATVTARIGGHLPAGLVLRESDPGLFLVPPALEPAGVTPDDTNLLVRTDGSRLAAAGVVGRLTRDFTAYIPVFSRNAGPAPPGGLARLEVLLTAIALLVMGIAAAGLAIGAIEGVLERRRTLAHLAATGVPAGTLRTATALELAAPMAAAVALAVAVGIGTGGTFIHLYYGGAATPVVVPWTRILALVLAAVAATAGVVALTLPMVGRSIGAEGLRTE
jgi:hypothetical protein